MVPPPTPPPPAFESPQKPGLNRVKQKEKRVKTFNDTHREKLCFTQFNTKNGCLAASDLSHMFTQSITVQTFHYQDAD